MQIQTSFNHVLTRPTSVLKVLERVGEGEVDMVKHGDTRARRQGSRGQGSGHGLKRHPHRD